MEDKREESTTQPVKPGEAVSVDQTMSPTAGLVAQTSGFTTKKRHKHAAVFVDHASGFGHTHIQKSPEITILGGDTQAKLAFEKVAASHGVAEGAKLPSQQRSVHVQEMD